MRDQVVIGYGMLLYHLVQPPSPPPLAAAASAAAGGIWLRLDIIGTRCQRLDYYGVGCYEFTHHAPPLHRVARVKLIRCRLKNSA